MSNVPTENDFPSCGEAMTTGQPKFFIINNGMKDLRGHYLETSVSIAEASAELGFRPILAAHASCHESAAPQEIEFHPVFTVDYWMAEPPLPSLERRGLRGQLRPLLQAPASRLLDGSLTFTEYLAARFEAIGETGKSAKKGRTCSIRAIAELAGSSELWTACDDFFPWPSTDDIVLDIRKCRYRSRTRQSNR
jgi:hypothetical protein